MTTARQSRTVSTPGRTKRGFDRATPVFPFGLVEEPAETDAFDTERVLTETLTAAQDAASRTQREVWRREAERRRAAAALEADLRPVRIDETERAARRAVYVAAEAAVAQARSRHARAQAVADAAQLLADTFVDDTAAGAGVARALRAAVNS